MLTRGITKTVRLPPNIKNNHFRIHAAMFEIQNPSVDDGDMPRSDLKINLGVERLSGMRDGRTANDLVMASFNRLFIDM